MSESAYAARHDAFDDYGDDALEDEQMPGRPRRKLLNGWSVLALVLLVGAAGFYVGVRVEKSSVSGNGSSSSLASAFASRFGAGARAAAGTSSASSSGSSNAASGARTGAAGNASATGAAGATGTAGGSFPGAGRFGANATVGTVSSVSGSTIYLKETNGNTVKVKISRATQISKRQSVSRHKVYPGDTLIIQGASGSGGAVTATSITDSGSSGSSGSGGGSGSTSSGGQSSVIQSLFGGG